jgi:hypothetical protein
MKLFQKSLKTTSHTSNSFFGKNYIPSLKNKTISSNEPQVSDFSPEKHLLDPDFKLTARRRNNMHNIISGYNQHRINKLKKHMSKYLDNGEDKETFANLLLDLR